MNLFASKYYIADCQESAYGLQLMELAENRASGKIFVVLDDTNGGYFLVITPEGRVKRLERSLFFLGSEMRNADAEPEQLVSDKQVAVYKAYFGENAAN
jgi:hypothetical protein